MDWNILRRICLVGFLGLLAYSLYPWALCTFDRLDGVQIGNVNEATSHGEARGSLDTARADNATSFLGGFFGSFGTCASAYPPGDGDPRQLGALGGLFFGIFFFRALDRRQYVRRVRKMSADYAAVEAVGTKKSKRDVSPISLGGDVRIETSANHAVPANQRKRDVAPIPISHEVRRASSANHVTPTPSARPSVKPIRQPSASTRTMYSATPPTVLDDPDDAPATQSPRTRSGGFRPASAAPQPRRDTPPSRRTEPESDGPDWEWD